MATATVATEVAAPPRGDVAAGEAESDPFQAIAEAMRRAAQEMQDCPEEPDVSGSEEPSRKHDGALSKAVYSTSYCVGYGVAFPTFLTLGMLPMNNPLGRGLRDGASSAKQSVRQLKESRAARKAAKKRPASRKAPRGEAG